MTAINENLNDLLSTQGLVSYFNHGPISRNDSNHQSVFETKLLFSEFNFLNFFHLMHQSNILFTV